MENRLAKFNELVPSTLPFVEGKLEGHKERKNYSIVGPGVAEDSKQFIKIAMPHSFNLGAVSALPKMVRAYIVTQPQKYLLFILVDGDFIGEQKEKMKQS